ncbi:MAG TPA: hypothetical protein VFA10_11650 [Ktedonobacteraceae bacterium]|nr:hypothetical protein [Ktedonobacteraceae bacterium]
MSRQQRLTPLPLVGMILLCLLVCLYLVARKRSEKPEPPSVSRHSVETSPAEALKYWTADKMRNAKPVPLPNVKALKRGKRHPQRPAVEPDHS